MSHNRILTRDNLQKRQHVNDLTCLFCAEPETTQHMFFDCVVATIVWEFMSLLLGKTLGSGLEQIAHFWVGNRRNEVLNMTTAAVLWSLWKCRNNLFFRFLYGLQCR